MPKEKQTIEQELVAATGVKPGKDREAFLTKIHTKVMELGDEDWDKLSEPAQKWANAQSKRVEKKEDLDDFPDAKKAAASEDEEAEEEEAPVAEKKEAKKIEKPAAKPTAKPAAKETKAPAAKADKPKKKEPGRIEKMKTIMLKNLKAKAEDLKAKLTAAGIEVSDATVTTVRSDFVSSIRVLQKAGKLSEDLLDLD